MAPSVDELRSAPVRTIVSWDYRAGTRTRAIKVQADDEANQGAWRRLNSAGTREFTAFISKRPDLRIET